MSVILSPRGNEDISTENGGVIDDYYRQMEIEANKADKRKGAK